MEEYEQNFIIQASTVKSGADFGQNARQQQPFCKYTQKERKWKLPLFFYG
jgi:hypothetical protein